MRMFFCMVCGFAVVFSGASWANINIQGTVTAAGQPVSGAAVSLAIAKITTTTAADGTFRLTGATSAIFRARNNGGFLYFAMPSANRLTLRLSPVQRVRVSLLTAQGQRAATLYDQIPSSAEFSLAMPEMSKGYCLLQVQAGTMCETIPWISGLGLGKTRAVAIDAPISAGLAKAMAFADTVVVAKAGYATKKVAVTDSVISNLQIVLVASTAPQGMVLIPAKNKTFNMGANGDEGYGDEYLNHKNFSVTITYDFYMDETEVTQAQYKALMNNINPSSVKNDNCPVNNISWFDAVLYCNKRSKAAGLDTVYTFTGGNTNPTNYTYPNAPSTFNTTQLTGLQIHYDRIGYRMPTEAEWEFACRGGNYNTKYFFSSTTTTGATYPTGEMLAKVNTYAWHNGNSNGQVRPVKQKLPNPYGLYDITGNVWEFTNIWAVNNGGAQGPYTTADAGVDPKGPTSGWFRAFRGGDWSYGSNACNCTFRSGGGTPDWRYIIPGFRCVLRVQ